MPSEAAKYDDDFAFVCEHLNAFVNRANIRRTLDLIDEVGITGWEKWWQVEFAAWLADEDSIGEWAMEECFLTDRRTRTAKNFIAMDVGFRLKGFSTREFLFVELKQHRDWTKCIGNMLRDIDKRETAQKRSESGLRIRNFFVAGVYLTEDTTRASIADHVEERAAVCDLPLERRHVHTRVIADTPYSLTIF